MSKQPIVNYRQLPPIVRFVNEMNITGHVIPENWFKWLKYKSGKPHMNAMYILADIVYWHRPVEEQDEKTGKVTGYRKKFSGPKLQRTRKYYEDKCGFTNQQARDALNFLANEIGVIIKHVEDKVTLPDGRTLSNVPYLDLVPEVLYRITFIDPDDNTLGSTEPTPQKVGSTEPIYESIEPTPESTEPTYTETTTENPLKDKEEGELDNKWMQIQTLYQNNINISISPIIVEEMMLPKYLALPLEWWRQAVRIASANNARKWSYVRGVLERSINAGLSPEDVGPPETNNKNGTYRNGASNGTHRQYNQTTSKRTTGRDLANEPTFNPYTGEELPAGSVP